MWSTDLKKRVRMRESMKRCVYILNVTASQKFICWFFFSFFLVFLLTVTLLFTPAYYLLQSTTAVSDIMNSSFVNSTRWLARFEWMRWNWYVFVYRASVCFFALVLYYYYLSSSDHRTAAFTHAHLTSYIWWNKRKKKENKREYNFFGVNFALFLTVSLGKKGKILLT